MGARRTHFLLRRLKQAIAGGLIGCVVSVVGENQVGEVVRNGATQDALVSHPSMTTESVCKVHVAIEIDGKCAGSETGNFQGSYAPVWSFFDMRRSGPQVQKRNIY
jgi:hypothetical protein